jgi:hypothetical protein
MKNECIKVAEWIILGTPLEDLNFKLVFFKTKIIFSIPQELKKSQNRDKWRHKNELDNHMSLLIASHINERIRVWMNETYGHD